ncbi:hypothetical protein ALP59_200032 [Pseudomonas savastanoi]|uniref:Uncharacterized protein n=1 Tax=Pseudomonas savastanoi TaxID=29438 RepID=A0A3M5G419_PSESS|nr:hypothetical protein ALP59_200032 [Pseudomonas savastanoi]
MRLSFIMKMMHLRSLKPRKTTSNFKENNLASILCMASY